MTMYTRLIFGQKEAKKTWRHIPLECSAFHFFINTRIVSGQNLHGWLSYVMLSPSLKEITWPDLVIWFLWSFTSDSSFYSPFSRGDRQSASFWGNMSKSCSLLIFTLLTPEAGTNVPQASFPSLLLTPLTLRLEPISLRLLFLTTPLL